ncbi:unnamed protein product [Prorocentrum cordatum]|uniref:Uncharacterized protein n=1 Tax=Prorocentrum cordatum TaxID=2364126 RepID=A0ABN9VDI0_9DINO|nr:unnamed protein product [Polarella glacialis]
MDNSHRRKWASAWILKAMSKHTIFWTTHNTVMQLILKNWLLHFTQTNALYNSDRCWIHIPMGYICSPRNRQSLNSIRIVWDTMPKKKTTTTIWRQQANSS